MKSLALRVLAAGGLLCGLAPLALTDEPPPSVEVLVGAGVSVSDATDALPVARVTVDAPIYLGRSSAARIRAALAINGSSGETLDLTDVRTFRGAELDVEVERRIGEGNGSSSYVVLKVGGSARRDAQGEGPWERFPGWWGAGFAVEHRDESGPPTRRLTITWGSSQLCHTVVSGAPRDLIVTGHVQVAKPLGASVVIQGDIHRPIYGEGRSNFRLAVLVGWGK